MNYQKHYDLLCERAKNRQLDCYTENHHIIPLCMDGPDVPDNKVALTPEEHYVAHQLLIRMYPDHEGLEWATLAMTTHPNGKRINNKLYGWIRRRIQKRAKQRTGSKNGSFGKSWYHDPETLENVKCIPGDEPNGFIKGRKLKRKRKTNNCIICGQDTESRRAKYCDKHRSEKKITDNRQRKFSKETRKKISNSWNQRTKQQHPTINKICIYKDNIEKRISESELNIYLNNGWKKGRNLRTIS